jgi:hypothetical protein
MSDSDLAKQKADSDFVFLKSLIGVAKINSWRVVVSGGYGMDFFLGKITRSHNDLDMIIYGKENKPDAVRKLNGFILDYFPKAKILTKPQEFYTEVDINDSDFSANIYFVETVNDPQLDLNKIRKLDGEVVVNTEDKFPKPVPGRIGDFEIEVQDQSAHLADILKRRGHESVPNKRDPDIEILGSVTDPKKVEFLLKQK